MRVIRYALIAILLLSAGSARAQQLREIPRITNRHAAWQKRVLQRPKAASAQPQQATAVPGLEEPAQLAFDTSGNLYIADPTLQQVLKVTPQGVVSVFAGTGDAGFTGDGGPAVDATLEDPFGVAVDASGNVFIADTENNVIREVTTDGNINTVAGSNPPTVCAQKTDAFGDNCAATQATLNLPEAVAIDDNGNLLIGDTYPDSQTNTVASLVRKVTKSTQIISLIAGGGAGTCTGATNNFGDGCPATDAILLESRGLAADTKGNVFIADDDAAVVRVVNSQGVISLYAGNYSPGFTSNNVLATSTTLDEVENVAVDASGKLIYR